MTTTKRLLTIDKAREVKAKKPDALRGSPVHMNYAVTARYEAKLNALVQQMASQTRRELERLFKGDPARAEYGQQKTIGSATIPTADADVSSQARIKVNQLKQNFQQLFNRKARGLAEQMLNDCDKASASAVHQSLKELSGGLSLKTKFVTQPMQTVLKAHLAENVSLIKSIPQKYFLQIEGSVMRSITTGNGLQDLVPAIKKYNGMTLNRARLIAQDQTRKIYSNLNFERYDKIGIKEFEWVHSAGSNEPRPLHVDLDGQIFSLDNLPVIDDDGTRGIPGQLINCKCISKPVVRFKGED